AFSQDCAENANFLEDERGLSAVEAGLARRISERTPLDEAFHEPRETHRQQAHHVRHGRNDSGGGGSGGIRNAWGEVGPTSPLARAPPPRGDGGADCGGGDGGAGAGGGPLSPPKLVLNLRDDGGRIDPLTARANANVHAVTAAAAAAAATAGTGGGRT
ncbi:unnamed protein product, partial [Laminaria digitata]